MKTPYFIMTCNTPGTRVFRSRAELEDFNVTVSSQLADIMPILASSKEEPGFIQSAMEMATDMAFQLQQAAEVLRDWPEGRLDADWISATPPAPAARVTESQDGNLDELIASAVLDDSAADDSNAFLPPSTVKQISSALPLLLDAMNAGEGGDAGDRCIATATIQLEAILQGKTGFRGGAVDPLDMLYDAESILEAVSALHPSCGRGSIVRVVLEQLAHAGDAIDKYRIDLHRRSDAPLVEEAVPA